MDKLPGVLHDRINAFGKTPFTEKTLYHSIFYILQRRQKVDIISLSHTPGQPSVESIGSSTPVSLSLYPEFTVIEVICFPLCWYNSVSLEIIPPLLVGVHRHLLLQRGLVRRVRLCRVDSIDKRNARLRSHGLSNPP